MTALTITDLPGVPLVTRDKVRDIYQVGEDLLIVATDRISAFDYVLSPGIPRKGEVLNRISLFWFDYLRDVVPNHVITARIEEYPRELRQYRDHQHIPHSPGQRRQSLASERQNLAAPAAHSANSHGFPPFSPLPMRHPRKLARLLRISVRLTCGSRLQASERRGAARI